MHWTYGEDQFYGWLGSMAATLVTRELDVRTDSDERSAIASPGRGDPGMGVKTWIRSRARFPGSCR
jgi:hypothetical protein